MSGYRTLHREDAESTAIWNVATSPMLISSSSSSQKKQQHSGQYRVWTASADGLVRSYRLREKSMQDDDVLDASALSMTCSHVLTGADGNTAGATTALGCTQVCVARNYVGEDDAAGDLIVASLDMAGTVRLWNIPEDEDGATADTNNSSETASSQPKTLKADHEFKVENATGTVMMICPPRWTGPGKDVSVAVTCLDGTIAQVATGWMTPSRLDGTANSGDDKAKKQPTPAGTVIDRLGSRGSSIALSIASHPMAPGIAVGRQDGLLDTIPITTMSNSQQYYDEQSSQQQPQRRHRLRLPCDVDAPIRAVCYTPDGNLLAAGNDYGSIAVWDVSRGGGQQAAVLVHHIVQAHANSWVLDMVALYDSRRWVTCGADRKLHVWKVDQMYQPVHTYDTDQTVWTMGLAAAAATGSTTGTVTTATAGGGGPLDKAKTVVRLAAGTERGGLQILSLDS